MDVRLPDGTIIRGVPDGTSKQDVLAFARSNGVNVDRQAPQEQTAQRRDPMSGVSDGLRLATPAGLASALFSEDGRQSMVDAGAGMVRGAGSIGATGLRLAGIDSADENRARRSDMNAGLRTLGADPDSFAFGMGKLGTEVGGTWAIPGMAGRAVARALPRLGQAISSGGFNAGRAAPGMMGAAANMGTRIAGGAAGGAMMAGAIDPESAGTGALIGGLLPPVARVAGVAGQTIGNVFSKKTAADSAARKVASVLGDDAGQTVADLQTYYPKGAENIPLSAAAITQSPKLAQLERGSRLHAPDAWYGFDKSQAKASYDNVLKATQEAELLADRAAQRGENWRDAWEKASSAMKPRIWQRRMTQFGADMETALRAPESSNPSVRAVLQEINSEFDRLGPNFGIGNLQQMRANLQGKQVMTPGDAFKSAPRDSPAIISLKKEMDDILNAVTGGKWQKVIEGYAKDSGSLHAAKAAQKVRNAYTDAETARVLGPVIGSDSPLVTAANLTRAMNSARVPQTNSLALSGPANQRLEATLAALRRQGIVQEVKRTSTAGGGSATTGNDIAAGIVSGAGGHHPGLLMQAISLARRAGAGRTDDAMAGLLSNPDELQRVLGLLNQPYKQGLLSQGASRLPLLSAQ